MRLMMRRTCLLVLLGLCLLSPAWGILTGCGETPAPAETPESSPAEAVNVLPEDITLYPNSKKVLAKEFGANGAFQIRTLTEAEPENVLQYYENYLGRKRWQIVSRITGRENLVIYRKDERILRISVVPTDDPDVWMHIVDYGKE